MNENYLNQQSFFEFQDESSDQQINLSLENISQDSPQLPQEDREDQSDHDVDEVDPSPVHFLPMDAFRFDEYFYNPKKGFRIIFKESANQESTYIIQNIEATELKAYFIFQQKFFKLNKGAGVPSILKLRDNGNQHYVFEILYGGKQQMKIEIQISQITNLIGFRKQKTLCLCFQDAPKFYFNNSTNKNRTFWERANNCMLSENVQNQLFLKQLCLRNPVFMLNIANFDIEVNKIKKALLGFHEVIINDFEERMLNTYQMNELETKYSEIEFGKFFTLYREQDSIKSFQIEFSLVSLLYTCHKVDVVALFRLAHEIAVRYETKMLPSIWKVATRLQASAVIGDLKRNKSLTQIFIDKLKNELKFKQNYEIDEEYAKIPTLKITPSGVLPSGWSIDLRNRLIRHYKDFDFQFIKIRVSDDNQEKGPLHCCQDYMRELLEPQLKVIDLLGRSYIPLGWTQSQLKSSSMWYTLQNYHQFFIPREELLQFLGEFKNIKNPALKAARIGQNLTTSYFFDISQVKCIPEKDKVVNGYKYTDGIGCISPDLVQKIQKQFQTTSTVFQVRYKGAKGILAMNRLMGNNEIIIRDSMNKFSTLEQTYNYLDIIEFSCYKPAFLNRQIIILLAANGISVENLLEIQKEYIQNAINLDQDSFEGETGFKEKHFKKNEMFEIESIGEVMEKINAEKSLRIIDEPTLRGILMEKYIGMFSTLVKKSKIRVERSSRLLGIIDEYFILGKDQIYCTIVNKQKRQNISGRVLLTKNPCLHPADIRVVNCISKEEAARRFHSLYGSANFLEDLVNCIIFPQAGQIPLTCQISGSDLDGDEFFICWDPRLIPKKSRPPVVVDDLKPEQRVWKGTGYDEMMNFFTEFIFNTSLGRLANCHLAKADLNGADCQDCLELCKVYSKALDYPKKGYKFEFDKKFWIKSYPHYMQKQKTKKSYHSTSAVGRLYDQAKHFFEQFMLRNKNTKFKIGNINTFYSHTYSDAEIKYAVNTILEYQNEIEAIMKIFKLERQFTLYNFRASDRNKQSRDRVFALGNLRSKYFIKFFKGLNIEYPQEYYSWFRTAENEQMSEQVEKRLLLWYQISYTNWLKFNPEKKKQFQWLHRLNKFCQSSTIRIIGLTWFCVPYLTFHMLKQERRIN